LIILKHSTAVACNKYFKKNLKVSEVRTLPELFLIKICRLV